MQPQILENPEPGRGRMRRAFLWEVALKITVKKTTEVEEEVDVEFPLYISCGDWFDTGSSYDTIKRVQADGSYVELTCRKDNYRGEPVYELGSGKINLAEALGELLFEEAHYCRHANAIVFNAMYVEIETWMKAL